MCDSPRPRPPVLNRSRRLLIDALPVLLTHAPGLAREVAVYLAGCLGTAAPDRDVHDLNLNDPAADALAAELARAVRT